MAKIRFHAAASWIVQLLRGHLFSLEHRIELKPTHINPDEMRVEFDASVWGGGFVFWEKGLVQEWGVVEWSPVEHLGVVPNQPRWQTFWEMLMPQP